MTHYKFCYSHYIIILLFISYFCSSCEPKEKAIEITEKPDTSIHSIKVPLTSNYRYQKYFSLDEMKIVSTNYKMDWDIGLRMINNLKYVYLNSSRAMYAYGSEEDFSTNFSSDLDYKWDNPNGDIDSLVIGNETNKVYVLDMGYDPDLNHQSYKKIKFTNDSVTVANLDGSMQKTIAMEVDDRLLITPLSFQDKPVSFPDYEHWDLLFTQYTHQFDSITPYLVTGALLNPLQISATIDTTHSFDEIDFTIAQSQTYSSNFDAIGFDWKSYNIEMASYSIHPKKTFLIKTKESKYYKMRFTDFYDATGNKGEISLDIVEIFNHE